MEPTGIIRYAIAYIDRWNRSRVEVWSHKVGTNEPLKPHEQRSIVDIILTAMIDASTTELHIVNNTGIDSKGNAPGTPLDHPSRRCFSLEIVDHFFLKVAGCKAMFLLGDDYGGSQYYCALDDAVKYINKRIAEYEGVGK